MCITFVDMAPYDKIYVEGIIANFLRHCDNKQIIRIRE